MWRERLEGYSDFTGLTRRAATPDFELNETALLAKVEPGPYVVVPFEDKGLQPHTAYYYRVRAVDREGHKGQPSEVCRGLTREP